MKSTLQVNHRIVTNDGTIYRVEDLNGSYGKPTVRQVGVGPCFPLALTFPYTIINPNKVDKLKKQADEALKMYPQYKGHFDKYVLVIVTRQVHTKMGLAFDKGEICIASAVENHEGFRTVYSVKNNCDTSIDSKFVVNLI